MSPVDRMAMPGDDDSLVAAWNAARGTATRSAALARALRDAVDAAHAAWPGIVGLDDAFVRRMAQCVSADAGVEAVEAIGALHVSHLYLSCACLAGDPRALAALEKLWAPAIASALARFADVGGFRQDVAADVRARMLVGHDGRPRLEDYRGRGELPRWVRVAVTRLAVDRTRGRGGREDPSSHRALLDGLDASTDPEMRFFEEKYQQEFRAAFESAVAELTARERRLLRERLVHRLGVVEIAALHDTSKSSAARWVDAARDRLVRGIHAQIAERLQVSETELRSVMAMVRSKIHLSVSRVLDTPDP